MVETLFPLLAMNVSQALLSAIFSVLLGYVLARCAFYYMGRWGGWFINGLMVLFFTPQLVFIVGNGMVFGESIFGLYGVVLTHCQTTIPLTAFILFQSFTTIPQRIWYFAQNYQLSVYEKWWVTDGHTLKTSGLAVCIFVFLLSFTSFVVVISMGGGAVESLESEIYYQFYGYNNPGQSLIIIAIQAFLILALLHFYKPLPLTTKPTITHQPQPANWWFILTGFMVLLAICAPLSAVLWQFLHGFWQFNQWADIGQILMVSLGLAVVIWLLLVMALLTLPGRIWPYMWVLPPVAFGILWVNIWPFLPEIPLVFWYIALQIWFVSPICYMVMRGHLLTINNLINERTMHTPLNLYEKLWVKILYCAPQLTNLLGISVLFTISDYTAVAVLGINDIPLYPQLLFSAIASYQWQYSQFLAGLLFIISLFVCFCMKIANKSVNE